MKVSKIIKVALYAMALSSVSCYAVQPPSPDPIVESQDVDLTWDHAITRKDETPLPLDEISHYEIFYGLTTDQGQAVMINAGKTEAHTITGLTGGEYQFWMWTVDTDGVEGDLSEEARKTIVTQSRPSAVVLEAN